MTTTTARITETMINDKRNEMAHAQFKRSNANAAAIQSQAKALEDRGEADQWTDTCARLENEFLGMVEAYHAQKREKADVTISADLQAGRAPDGGRVAAMMAKVGDRVNGVTATDASNASASDTTAAPPLFPVGARVMLKSGGQIMEVEDCAVASRLCSWNDSGSRTSEWFAASALRVLEPHEHNPPALDSHGRVPAQYLRQWSDLMEGEFNGAEEVTVSGDALRRYRLTTGEHVTGSAPTSDPVGQ